MQTFNVKTTVSNDGTLTIKGLHFRAGEKVKVIVRSNENLRENGKRYPLRGKPIQHDNPFGSVAEDDWESLK